jgi:hypothetical protein
MRGLTPLDYELLQIMGDVRPDRLADRDDVAACWRLMKEGRCLVDSDEVLVLTPAGREAMRIYEAILAVGVSP